MSEAASKHLSVRRRLAVAALCLLALLIGAVSADAAHGPDLSWTLPISASAGSAVSFTWTASHLAPHSPLVVQRQEGTARSWRTVARLAGASGSASLPGLPMGSYRLRLAVLGSRPLVRGYQQRLLEVFGQVPFSTLFPDDQAGGVYTTATSTFPYLGFVERQEATASGLLTDSHNNCRSVHLEFVPGHNGGLPNEAMNSETGTMTLVQETHDPVSVSTPFNTVAGLTAAVVPGQSWSVNLSQTGTAWFTYYVNGSASCDSGAAVS